MTRPLGFVLETASSLGIFGALLSASAVSYVAVTFDWMLWRLALMSGFASSSEEAIVENGAFDGVAAIIGDVEIKRWITIAGLLRDLIINLRFIRTKTRRKGQGGAQAQCPVACYALIMVL